MGRMLRHLTAIAIVAGVVLPTPFTTTRAAGAAERSVTTSGFIVDPRGQVTRYFSSEATPPTITGGPSFPFDIARAISTFASGTGGVILDGWGGIHPFGYAGVGRGAEARNGPYWQGWDIARGIALLPDGTGGYLLDGWGGIHPFAVGPNPVPPAASGGPYWKGWDIARGIALLPNGTGGYVVDGYGGLHPFAIGGNAAAPKPVGGPYWNGWDIARDVTLLADGSGGFVLDGYGPLHPFATTNPSPPHPPVTTRYGSGNAQGVATYLHPSNAAPTLTVTNAVTGLDIPWDLAFAPDGTMLFTERPGRLDARVGGVTKKLADAPSVYATGEAGLLGMTLDPDFATNHRLYACQSFNNGTVADVRVLVWQVANDYSSATVVTNPLVGGLPLNTSTYPGRHSGCRLRFGPDGYLWIGTGDTAVGTVPQSLSSLGGKVLRVDKTTGAAAPDNPFSGAASRIYSYGHRNVQGLAWRPGTTQMFNIEHGPNIDDEVNLQFRGANYGWDPVSGYNEGVPMTDFAKFPSAVGAIWSSGNPTIATSGGTFVTGTQWGSWNGALVVGCLAGTRLKAFGLNGSGTSVLWEASAIQDKGRLRTPVQGPDGNLYVLTSNGGGNDVILKVVPS
jgi:glucose/arabinose dehydrogenase